MSEAIEPGSSPVGLKPGSACKLVRMAINNRWPIPDDIRQELPTIMGRIVENAEVDRDKIAAAKVIVAMEGQNQQDDHVQDKNQRLDAGKPTEAVQFKAFLGIDESRI